MGGERQPKEKRPWDNSVVYQVYPWTFNEDGERTPQLGHGSINGITEKLDYLSDLGVDAIWISPFYPSPMIDGGYDISDYTDINPELGTLDDFDRLVTACHEHGLRIMLDFVPNHTSSEHEWFKKSERREEGYDNWYIWHPGKLDENGKRVPPNNWGSVFSIPNKKARERGDMPDLSDDEWTPYISAWRWNEYREEYYLASFAAEQPDLNWSNPYVREAMKNVMRFWLDRGVDGFRVDVLNHLAKDMSFTDEDINTAYNEDDYENPYDRLMKYRSCGYTDALHQYTWEMAEVLREEQYEGRHLRMIFEAYMDRYVLDDIDRIAPDIGVSFNFTLFKLELEAPLSVRKLELDAYYANLPEGAIGNQVNGNHDNVRLATRVGDAMARTFGVANLFMPGMKFIYNGEELGLHNAAIPVARMKDPNGLRDGERTPMPFDNTKPNYGFSDADPDITWLPVNEEDEHLAVNEQRANPKSSHALYRTAIRMMKELPAAHGDYVPLHTDNEHVLVFGRQNGDDKLVVAMNFSEEAQQAMIVGHDFTIAKKVLSSLDITDIAAGTTDIDLAQGVGLEPKEMLVIVPRA